MNEPLTPREMIDMHRLLEIEIATYAEQRIAAFLARTGTKVISLATAVVCGDNDSQLVTCSIEVVL